MSHLSAGQITRKAPSVARASGTAAARPAPRKRVHAAFEQSELWPAPGPEAERIADTAAPAEDRYREPLSVLPEPARMTSAEPPPAPVRKSGPRPVLRPLPSVPVQASRSAAGQSMARLMNVNGAIEGVNVESIRFDISGHGLGRTLRLWKGTSESNDCVPVYF